MKTPMQEMLEWVRETLPMDLETPRLITPRLIEHKIESMLEKEKEVMCGFGENVRGAMLKSDKHRTTEEVYNETFKTKEK